MVYKVMGLMSGSSLDGLDIAYVQLEETRGAWTFELVAADCVPYSSYWQQALRHASDLNVPEFLKLNTAYGRYLGEAVLQFVAQHNLQHSVHFIASHGHTVFHEPQHKTTFQLGDGASLAAVTGIAVINDLRALDVALGGQGAPIVPVGDKYLFGSYGYLLNIGGIANITAWRSGQPIAFDVCPANQVLNALAQREGKDMDEDGALAREGAVIYDVIAQLEQQPYYQLPAPKSLSNEAARDMAFPALLTTEHRTCDLLHTYCLHIAQEVYNAISRNPTDNGNNTMLVTGGGALNSFLVSELRKALAAKQIQVDVPNKDIVQYKEAIVMALIGTLRWREETNVFSSVTGASRDSVGGALWTT